MVPTAIHELAEVQLTELRLFVRGPPTPPPVRRQLWPFHASENATDAGNVPTLPTLMQSSLDGQETASNSALPPDGVWPARSDQACPFHPAVKTFVVFPPLISPTATHDSAEEHDTPFRYVPPMCAGAPWTVQAGEATAANSADEENASEATVLNTSS